MGDRYSFITRRRVMQSIHPKDTRPEMTVRRLLHSMGHRYRLHRSDLPGRPDIVLPGKRTIILVNGCFWHQHPGCKLARMPKSNQESWRAKLEENRRRDERITRVLRSQGWRVIVIWECQVNRKKKAPDFMRALLVEYGFTTSPPGERYTQLKFFEIPREFIRLKHSSMV